MDVLMEALHGMAGNRAALQTDMSHQKQLHIMAAHYILTARSCPTTLEDDTRCARNTTDKETGYG